MCSIMTLESKAFKSNHLSVHFEEPCDVARDVASSSGTRCADAGHMHGLNLTVLSHTPMSYHKMRPQKKKKVGVDKKLAAAKPPKNFKTRRASSGEKKNSITTCRHFFFILRIL